MTSPVWPQVVLKSFNPYEARYPGRRVVSRDTLHLIKTLRSEGHSVVVEPDDGTKLNYLAEKGVAEFLTSPVFMTLVNIPLSLIIGIAGNWIYDKLKRKPASGEVNLILEVDERGRLVRYDHRGMPITDERFEAILRTLDQRARQYAQSLKVVPPTPARPFPIYLEHTSKIVGWGNVTLDDKGLKVHNAQITDSETRERVKKGELKGLSIGGLVYESTCSVCKHDYVDCNHIASRGYGGAKCTVTITGIDLAEISIVQTPVNPDATIKRI